MARDLRRFHFTTREGRNKVWGWEKTLKQLRHLCALHSTFQLHYGEQLICESRWDGGDEWEPYVLYFSKGLPGELWKSIVEAIKKKQIRIPKDL